MKVFTEIVRLDNHKLSCRLCGEEFYQLDYVYNITALEKAMNALITKILSEINLTTETEESVASIMNNLQSLVNLYMRDLHNLVDKHMQHLKEELLKTFLKK